MSTEPQPEVLTEGEWNVVRFEATPVSLPLILKLGAHHGAWPEPKDQSVCPCCGRKGESA
jgi:hypothetical protein